ncbi:glycosyltransferase family 1 protein [Photobacterium galatheae]|uniref:Glycosyltransferase n=1 Tax=Photobacterium galatheae TaxID=1654360 RepID=A0A066RLK0_9GAMM|nr:glycosyltransferase family 1 protein [Photobacterium galatheae]KDM90011.1 hypothetical protein EA58_18890 [Photobacterium galatheae]MCM0149992.1 glycosyltransferase family 1 protein [Photobacterium galatheae]
MKILSILNISNIDDINCDSGFVFQCLMAKEAKQHNFSFSLIGPDIPAFREVDFPGEKIYLDIGGSKYESRYKFPWDEFSRIIDEVKPDTIFNNQIEYAPIIRAILETKQQDCQIYSYIHYLPVEPNGDKFNIDSAMSGKKISETLLMSIVSGVFSSDKLFIQSNFAKELMHKVLETYNMQHLSCKVFISPPPVDSRMVKSDKLRRREIIYNHRLYKHYGTEEFIEKISLLSEKTNFTLKVCDPMPSRSRERNRLDPYVSQIKSHIQELPFSEIFNEGYNRDKYCDQILSARLAIASFRKGAVWSMSVLDCLSLGTPVLAPDIACYRELVPESMLFRNDQEFFQKAEKILNCEETFHQMSTEAVEWSKTFSAEKTFHQTFLN